MANKILNSPLHVCIQTFQCDKQQASPSDLNSWLFDGFSWLPWMLSYCRIIPFYKNPSCCKTNPQSFLLFELNLYVDICSFPLPANCTLCVLVLSSLQAARSLKCLKRADRRRILRINNQLTPIHLPPTLLLQLDNT